MTSSPSPNIETFQLGPLVVPRIWTGLWQLSSNAWGTASSAQIRRAMERYARAGFTAFGTNYPNLHQFPRFIFPLRYGEIPIVFDDTVAMTVPWLFNISCANWQADHYGSAEILFGRFRTDYPEQESIIGATKWCIFKSGEDVTRSAVLDAVRERMKRMQCSRVDHLQFHWQDYSDRNYITCLNLLHELRDEGLISAIGLCNFDTIRTDEICTLLGPGVVCTNQVQFSLIDTRPLHGMSDVCEKHNLKLLTYGTLCGGFLSNQWIDKEEPDPYGSNLSPSQRKYLDIIVNAWGTWELFQSLLILLREIGNMHGGVSVSNVATRWVLEHTFVGAVIIGARLGITDHVEDNVHVFSFSLTPQDKEDIERLLARSNSRQLVFTVGDCGAEYR